MKISNISMVAIIGIFPWGTTFGGDTRIDMEELARKIEASPAYERTRQLTEKIEEELNRRVQAKVTEKRATIEAVEEQIYKDLIATDPAKGSTRGPNQPLFDEKEKVFLFVSRSVPLETLKNYAAAINTLGEGNIRLVFRAFPKNFLDSMLRKSPDCTTDDCVVKAKITIGPKLFKRYAINQVPVVVYDPNPADMTHANWLKVSGAASLEKILSLFYRETGEEALQIAARRVGHQ